MSIDSDSKDLKDTRGSVKEKVRRKPRVFSNTNPETNMHYRLKTIEGYRGQLIKTACARNVPKSEATTSRMSVTCETCLRYIEEKGKGGNNG